MTSSFSTTRPGVVAWTFVTVQMVLLAALTALPFTGGGAVSTAAAWPVTP